VGGTPLLKSGLSVHGHTDTQTKVKTVYPPVSLRLLGGYNETTQNGWNASVPHGYTS